MKSGYVASCCYWLKKIFQLTELRVAFQQFESNLFQSSTYLDRCYVVYAPGQVLEVERIPRNYQNFPNGRGPDTGGGNTLGMLQAIRRRFGPVASFSGAYRANSWTLQISRQNRSGALATISYEIANCSFIGITVLICRLYITNNH